MAGHRFAFRRGLTALIVGLILVSGFAPVAAALEFGRSTVTIETVTGGKYRFAVEVAETPAELQQGLMYRDAMAEEAGMLFLFGEERYATFWMKNTFVALDMLFIARDGHILAIHQKALPGSQNLISPTMPVFAVMEINAGLVARLGIHLGDRVHHKAFD
ncbi:DUF192 domain-containing protein [uncultured Gammaproteobacteria bacterium]